MFKKQLIHSVAAAALIGVPASVSLPTAGWAQISEIVVTTRKREENLQDLPLAVTAVGFETLQRQGTSSLEDITKFSPSFIFDQNSAQKDVRVAVRGLSATRGRSNVAFLVDGIDVTSEAIGTAGASVMTSQRLLGDVQRVEAVKGPQSALYGRAAFAGAINYVTKDAPDEFEGYVSAEAAEHEEYSVTTGFGGPIVTDKLGFYANAFWWDEKGQYENSISGSPLGGGDGYGGAFNLNFTPTENIRIKGRIEYADEAWNDQPRARFDPDTILSTPAEATGVTESTGSNAGDPSDNVAIPGGIVGTTSVISNYGDISNAVRPLVRSENWRTGDDYEGVTQEMFRASLVASWDIDAIKGTLTSYTGFTDSDVHEEYDWDSLAIGRPDTQLGTQDIYNDTDTEIFSQEIRYQSDFDGPIQITLGANYWSQERNFIESGLLGNASAMEGVAQFASVSGDLEFLGIGAPGAVFDGTDPAHDLPSWQAVFAAGSVGGANIRPRDIKDKHRSIYAMVEWEINEQFKATFEGRYSEEDQRDDSNLMVRRNPIVDDGMGNSFTLIQIFEETCSIADYFDPGESAWLNACFTAAQSDTTLANPALDDDYEAYRHTRTSYSNFFTPKLTLEWTPDDDKLFYFSAAKAQKPAGIDTLGGGGAPIVLIATEGTFDTLISSTNLPGTNAADAFQVGLSEYNAIRAFRSEKMWAYEVGAKTNWSGGYGDVVLNASAFFQDYTDKQVSVRVVAPDGTLTRRTTNAGSAEVYGIELETQWQTPIEGLNISAAYTWLDTEYVEFDDVTTPTDIDGIAKVGNCSPIDTDGNGIADTCQTSRAGNQLERAPEHAFVAQAAYTRPLGNTNMDWFVEGDTQYQGERFVDTENRQTFSDYWLLNLRGGLEGENWEALVFIDNVLEDDTIKSGSQIPDFATTLRPIASAPEFVDVGILPPKRTIGVRAKYKF